MSEWRECKNHNLVVRDFANENLSWDSSHSKSKNLELKFLWLSKNNGAGEVEVNLAVEDALIKWQETGAKMKKRIFFTKLEQSGSYKALTSDLEYNELLIWSVQFVKKDSMKNVSMNNILAVNFWLFHKLLTAEVVLL